MKTTDLAKKALIFGSSLLVASTMFLTTSCASDDDIIDVVDGSTEVTSIDVSSPADYAGTTISGDIESIVKLDASKEYTLAGGVNIRKGAALIIPAGTTIKSDPNESVAYLLVERGAQLYAEGTKDNPIVFTSGAATPARGDWGGIIICGKAPINAGTEATAEVGDVQYGGTVSADNSGVLKYVRLEYTGNAINDDKEHNGFTFNGVGSGTTAEYLQAFMGNDDGFEFFGGTVNANYLVSTGSKDDSFDWTQGWVGSGSYWYAEQANDAGNRGIEGDNNSKNHTAEPYSNPTLTNVTLKGNGTDKGDDGLRLRVGTKATISNVLVTGFSSDVIDVRDITTINHLNAGDLSVSNLNAADDFSYKVDGGTTDEGGEVEYVNYEEDGLKEFSVNTTATGSGEAWLSGWTADLPSDLKVSTVSDELVTDGKTFVATAK
ncbi:MAG: hypothetical protein GY827_05765 [Cytophagales bacterium]|nr:hypothetical protein [Cytophagales bacterium]